VRALRIGLGLLVLLALGLAGAYFARAPEPPPAGSESARRLAPGPLPIASRDHTFVDTSRPTAANGDFPGAPARTLEATLWYPASGANGAHPLLVYSHGFMSMRSENVPLAELLASHGYVVVSLDFPLTNRGAPGGPNVADAVNQPGDVRFIIDQILGWGESERPFPGTIDPARIGALGLSLGGLTTELVTYHPRLRDPRVRAAVSIAGPAAFFDERFFANADVPFLMIAGTADAMIEYQANAAPIPKKVARGSLLAIANGSHAGFAGFADMFPLRLFGNPDSLGCRALLGNLEARDTENPFAGLGGVEDGIVFVDPEASLPCRNGAPAEALAAGRQLMITRLAALAFFESQFAGDAAERASQLSYLSETLARDFPEARWQAAASDARLASPTHPDIRM
jgi:dienelactone hydrolase